MQTVIEYILKNALPEGTDFSVVESQDEMGKVFTLNIPDDLRGQIIGKGGRNIKAIRDVVSIIARRNGERVYLKIAD
ncbi:KH domain-containing protein [Candidatus Dojkabacteria bacterium]|uniref:KH domain-containing protein n=1 Tax=Candidatus Dojkabacteria bacterium TaxID=2099670 RepID=A0A955I9F8_9BACT|nr:KH domain-containing protein [Candidatus Dojkabacteria bacterium]